MPIHEVEWYLSSKQEQALLAGAITEEPTQDVLQDAKVLHAFASTLATGMPAKLPSTGYAYTQVRAARAVGGVWLHALHARMRPPGSKHTQY